VSDKAQKTVRIKWIRSGIGFTYHQKQIVRSLGLRKLNQEVEKPDTPQIRGLVASVPHLVKIVEAPKTPAWKLVPEYTIHAPAAPVESESRGGSRTAPTSVPSPAEESREGVGTNTATAPAGSESGGGSPTAPTSADATGAGSAGDKPSAEEGQSGV
jgi:large subunit ribosomal protein L30